MPPSTGTVPPGGADPYAQPGTPYVPVPAGAPQHNGQQTGPAPGPSFVIPQDAIDRWRAQQAIQGLAATAHAGLGVRAVMDGVAQATSGSGSSGSSSYSGGGGAAAPAVDPMAELEALLKERMQTQIKTIRETYQPLFKNLRRDRKQGRKEIKRTGKRARQGLRRDAEETAARYEEEIEYDPIEGDISSDAADEIAMLQQAAANRRLDRADIAADRNAQLRGLTRAIQSAGISTLRNNSADLISQLKAQRAQEVGAQRTAFQDALFQLQAGALAPAGGGGGGGGGYGGGGYSGGGSSGAEAEAVMLLAQTLGLDPNVLMAGNVLGYDDNFLSYLLSGQQAQFEQDAANQQAILWGQQFLDAGVPYEEVPFEYQGGYVAAQNQQAQQQAAQGQEFVSELPWWS